MKRFIVHRHVATCYSAIVEAESEESVKTLLEEIDIDDLDLTFSHCEFTDIREEMTEYEKGIQRVLRQTQDGYEVVKQ